MRKTFEEVLKSAKFDVSLEYKRLHKLFYEELNAGVYINCYHQKYTTTYDFFNRNEIFRTIKFRGTALDLDDFENSYPFSFKHKLDTDSIDDLISFCEFIINLFYGYPKLNSDERIKTIAQMFLEQINRIIEAAGYMSCKETELFCFVPKDIAAISVSEIIDSPNSYKVIFYNHYSLKGNIPEKKKIIRQFADLLEPQQKKLKEINNTLATDLFNCFNNLNIRHNNADKSSSKYNPLFETISDSALEYLYDEVYQLCLLAFLEIDNVKRKQFIEEMLKQK